MPTHRHNPHALPLATTLVVLASLVFLNLDGYQIHLVSPWGGSKPAGEPPLINWVHGWPVGFVVRPSIYSVQAGRGVRVRSVRGEPGFYSRWPIDESPVAAFSGLSALCDLLFGLLLLYGTYAGTRKLARFLGLQCQFSLRALLITVFAAAVLVAGRDLVFGSRFVLEGVAILAIAFGACMCLLAIPWPARQRAAEPQGLTSTEAT